MQQCLPTNMQCRYDNSYMCWIYSVALDLFLCINVNIQCKSCKSCVFLIIYFSTSTIPAFNKTNTSCSAQRKECLTCCVQRGRKGGVLCNYNGGINACSLFSHSWRVWGKCAAMQRTICGEPVRDGSIVGL